MFPFRRRQRLLRVILGLGICVYGFILSRLVFIHYFQADPVGHQSSSNSDLLIQSAARNDGGKGGAIFQVPGSTAHNDVAVSTTKTSLKIDTTTTYTLAELSKLSKEERQALLVESLKRIRQKALLELNDPNHMELRFRENPGDGRPPFSTIVDGFGNITADVSDLLQFAIIGFGKCASTTMRDWLNTHPQIQCYYPHEVLDLMKHDIRQLLSRLYSMPPGTNIMRGFKSPVDLSIRHVMQYYGKYFYKTKLIVGLRHPVQWFESLYNFRIQNMPPDFDLSTFPKPNDARGHCQRSSHNTCTLKGEFAIFLRQLGKTQSIIAAASLNNNNITRQLVAFEQKLHQVLDVPYLPIEQPLPNPVFLYEIRQLQQQQSSSSSAKNNNTTADDTFRRDLANFLNVDYRGLSEKIPHYRPGQVLHGNNNSNSLQQEKDRYKINICDEQHLPVRKLLMRTARTSAAWIEAFLLPAADNHDNSIFFSNRSQFVQLIQDWKRDPCGYSNETAMIGQKLLKLLPEQYHLNGTSNINNNDQQE